MTLNGLIVCPALILVAYGTHHALMRVVPLVVGGAYLGAAASLGLVHGAWLWMTGTLEEAEEKLGEALEKKRTHDYQEQNIEPGGRPGKTIEIDFDAPLDESIERIVNA